MVYPLISEYTEAILSAEDNFNELSYLRPVLDDNDNPIMSSGNFAVVYKMRDINTGKYHAVKCFTRDQENRNKRYKNICSTLTEEESSYLTNFSFHEAELFVDSSQTDETEFPVLLMDWVDGKPLDKFIEEYSGNPFVLYELCYNFRQMAKWLVSKSFSHGDLKPDNILVQEDANIVLIDYDGMYVWTREKQDAPEGGTPEYRNPFHPTIYNEHMDDFALAVLALSLNLISISYDIQNKFNRGNGLLFSAEDIKDINNSEIFIFLRELLPNEPLLGQYYATFIKSLSGNKLFESDFDFGSEFPIDILLLNSYCSQHIRDYIERRVEEGYLAPNGVIYTKDKRGVIGFKKTLDTYDTIEIEEGTVFVYEDAFDHNTPKCNIHLPSTLRYFGRKSINYRHAELTWDSPWFSYQDGYVFTRDKTECIYKHLIDAKFDTKTNILGQYLFQNLNFDGIWPVNLKRIRINAFQKCQISDFLVIPEGVIEIKQYAFCQSSIKELKVPSTIRRIWHGCFKDCKNLKKIDFSINNLITEIQQETFSCNSSLEQILFPPHLKIIGKEAFSFCDSIQKLDFPPNLTCIGERSFISSELYSESIIKNLILPSGLEYIGEEAFINNKNLERIWITSENIHIGKDAFKNCISLKYLFYNSINKIDEGSFSNCSNFQIKITDRIKEIAVGSLTGTKPPINNSKSFIIKDETLYSKYYKYLIYNWGKDQIFSPSPGVEEIKEIAFLNKPFAIKVPDSCKQLPYFVKCLILPSFMECEYDIEWDILLTHDNIFIDDCEVIYSIDKKKLLCFSHTIKIESYCIIEGCEEIIDNAFREELSVDDEGASLYGNHLHNLIFPKSLKIIGDFSLKGCHRLTEIKLPNNIEYIGDNPFPNSLKEINCTDTKFSFIEGCLLKNNYQILWISPHTKAFHLPPTVKFKGMICESYSNCLVTNDNNLIYVLNNIDFFIAPKRVSKVCNQSFPYGWPRSKKLNLIYFQNGLKEIEEETWEWGRAPDDLYLPCSVNKIGNLVKSPKYHREYFYDHMFSKRIHIPFGSLSHFLEILPGIDPIKLIEDYDEFDPESI